MCHETYETQEMSLDRSQCFAHWFRQEIGTYFERNSTEIGFYFVCCELTALETERIRIWENTNLPKTTN